MDTINITPEIAAEALKAAVAKRGEDYVYEQTESGNCLYVRDGMPSCLIGQVLFDLGIPLERLKGADGYNSEDGDNEGENPDAWQLLDSLESEGLVSFRPAVQGAFRVAQSRQDCGWPWGYALHAALGELR
jgi:hypothetical protein